MIRLDKYLADMGIGTRSEVKGYIKAGKVQVEGCVCKSPEQKVDPGVTRIVFDGQPVGYQKFYYYMLNKPAGVVTAREDALDQTVLDIMLNSAHSIRQCCPAWKELSPVGRLDKDTEGLLLLTNDGALAHRLLAPGKHVDKVYCAKVQGEMTQADVNAFAEGIQFSDFTAMPAELKILLAQDGRSEVLIRMKEGKFHQIKRMVHAMGKEVTWLKRLSMGSLELDESLKAGEWRELTEQEVLELGGSV